MSGLEEEFPGQVEAQNLDATTPEAKVVIEQQDFQNHGLVIREPGGEVVWSQADHTVNLEDVREALRERLERR